MKKDEVEPLDPQATEGAIEAGFDDGARKGLATRTARDAAALGRHDEMVEPAAEDAAEELFAFGVAVRRVDEGDAELEETVQQGLYLLERSAVPDAGGAEAETGHLEIGAAQPGQLCHAVSSDNSRTTGREDSTTAAGFPADFPRPRAPTHTPGT